MDGLCPRPADYNPKCWVGFWPPKLGQILTQDVGTGDVKVLDKNTVDGSNPDPTSGVGIRPNFWGRNPTCLLRIYALLVGNEAKATIGVDFRPLKSGRIPTHESGSLLLLSVGVLCHYVGTLSDPRRLAIFRPRGHIF